MKGFFTPRDQCFSAYLTLRYMGLAKVHIEEWATRDCSHGWALALPLPLQAPGLLCVGDVAWLIDAINQANANGVAE
jgi:hypothetical protein